MTCELFFYRVFHLLKGRQYDKKQQHTDIPSAGTMHVLDVIKAYRKHDYAMRHLLSVAYLFFDEDLNENGYK